MFTPFMQLSTPFGKLYTLWVSCLLFLGKLSSPFGNLSTPSGKLSAPSGKLSTPSGKLSTLLGSRLVLG